MELWESKTIIQNWMRSMNWHVHGGIQNAANALGKDRRMIERYLSGEAVLKMDTRLAMSAIKMDLLAWGDKPEHAAGNFILFNCVNSTEVIIGDFIRMAQPDDFGAQQFFEGKVVKASAESDSFLVQITRIVEPHKTWFNNPEQWLGREVMIWPQHIYNGRHVNGVTYPAKP